MRIIIAGLGNPGSKYSRTRHNVGFGILDLIALEQGATFESRDKYTVADVSIAGHSVSLVKPTCGMNVSGVPLIELRRKADRLIIIHDDLDMSLGKVRLKKAGSGAGGHNGIKSVIDCVGNEFDRIKIGIGRPQNGDTIGWVLEPLPSEQWESLLSCYAEVIQKLHSLVLDYEKTLPQTSEV